MNDREILQNAGKVSAELARSPRGTRVRRVSQDRGSEPRIRLRPRCQALAVANEGQAMKLHFEPNLDYQLQAIEAVCDLFRGQEICRTEFTVTRDAGGPADAHGLRRKRPRHRQPADPARRRAAQEPERHPAPQRPAAVRRRSRRATSPWRWRPAPARPTSTCARSSS